MLLGDGEMQLYDEQKRPISFSEPSSTWTGRMFFAAYNAMKTKGGSIDSPSMSPTWLRGVDTLTDVGWDKTFIPIGPWIYGERTSEHTQHYFDFLDRERTRTGSR